MYLVHSNLNAISGNVAFRKHRFALNLISRAQGKVVRALRCAALLE